MKILKLGNDIEVNRYTCHNCKSLLSYTKYDIKSTYNEWQRTGAESSKRHVYNRIICPVCSANIILKCWVEEY